MSNIIMLSIRSLNITKKIIFFAATVTLLQTNIYAAPKNFVEYSRKNKKIVAMADIHLIDHLKNLKQAQKLELISSNIISNWLNKIEKQQVPTMVILEVSEEDANSPDFYSAGYLLDILTLYFKNPPTALNRLRYEFADNRTLIFKTLLQIQAAAIKFKLNPGLETNLEKVKEFKKHERKRIREGDIKKDISAKEFLDNTYSIIEKLGKRRSELKLQKSEQANTYINSYLDEKIKSIRECFNVTEKFLSTYDLNGNISDILIDLVHRCWVNARSVPKPVADLISFLADANFILAILEALNNYDQIVIIAGNQHIIASDSFLSSIGFTRDVQVTRNSIDVNSTTLPIQENILENLLDNAFVDPINRLIKSQIEKSTIGDIQKTNALIKKLCNNSSNCNKDNCKLRCSRCREVYYCSRDCQKQDWENHKNRCNTANISHT